MSLIIMRAHDAPNTFHPAVVTDEHEAEELRKKGQSAILSGKTAMRQRHQHRGAKMLLRISRHKSLVRSCEIKFRASFPHRKISGFWSATVTLKVALQGALDRKIIKATISGKPETLSDAEHQAQLAILGDTVETFALRLPELPTLLAADRLPASDAADLRDMMVRHVQVLLDGKNQQKENKNDAREARQEALNRLPDGTPLKIRRSTYAQKWQIGLKRGSITKSQAAHTCILRPDIFNSEELRGSTISNHQILPLMAAAQLAAKDADPNLFDFLHPSQRFAAGLLLDQQVPLHQSFRETEEVKERRRKAPKIWLQTGFYNITFGYKARIGFKDEVFMPCAPQGQKKHPSFAQADAGNVAFIQVREKGRIDPLTGFCTPAGLFVVSGEIADLLRGHEIGRSTLEPVKIFDQDNRPIPGDWHHLVIREEVSTILVQQCHPDLMSSLLKRAIKPHEIRVDPAAPGSLDIWTDPQAMPQGLFLSGRLYSALKKAKALPGLTFKPCDTT